MQSVAVALASERNFGTLGVAWTTLTPRTLLLAADATGRALIPNLGSVVVMFATLWVLVRFELARGAGRAWCWCCVTALTASIAVGVFMVGFIMRYRGAGDAYRSTHDARFGDPRRNRLSDERFFPGWAQAVGHALPVTWIARGLRAALVYRRRGQEPIWRRPSCWG